MRREIKAVASFELAKAVDAHEDAESLLQGKEEAIAFDMYSEAMSSIRTWSSFRAMRGYAIGVFEPESVDAI